MTRNKLKADK